MSASSSVRPHAPGGATEMRADYPSSPPPPAPRPVSVWAAVALAIGLATAAATLGAGDDEDDARIPPASPLPATTPPEVYKPASPDELANADKVFDKLDADRRGYVTREDTKDLLGFEDVFIDIDKADSGKLTREQFRKAWAIYRSKR
jgi:hypothetical protein